MRSTAAPRLDRRLVRAHTVAIARAIRDTLAHMAAAVAAHYRHRHEAQELLSMDTRGLRDLGLTRIDAIRIARRER